MAEMYFNVQSDNGTITNNHALRQWSSRYVRAIEDVKDPRVAMNLGNLLTTAGFVNVETKLINVPLAPWSNGKFVPSPLYQFSLTLLRRPDA